MYPGLEKENLGGSANGGGANGTGAASLHHRAWPAPARPPASSPLTARQGKPGTSSLLASGSTRQVLGPPAARGLFGGCPAPPASPSGFTDAGAAEPTLSRLHPADSADPTVQGPAPKRPRLAPPRAAVSWSLPAGTGASAGDSDSDGEDAVVSRRRPTPGKPPAAAHVVATWGAGAHWGAAPAWAQRQQEQRPTAPAAEEEDAWCGSDMEEDQGLSWAGWQPHRLPLYDEPEE